MAVWLIIQSQVQLLSTWGRGPSFRHGVGSPCSLDSPWEEANPFPTNGRVLFPASAGIYINFPINPKSTYVAQWNATYQRQIKDWVVSASYLGNKTTHLWMAGEVNPAIYNPAPGASTTKLIPGRLTATLDHTPFGVWLILVTW